MPAGNSSGKLLCIAILVAPLTACVGTAPSVAEAPASLAPPPPTASAATPRMQASALSYGAITTQVQRNKTTQLEILENFGGPNISTTDADGAEVWVYERSVTQTDIATQSKDYQGAINLGVSFGFPHFGGSAGGSAGMARSSGQSSSSAGTRTLTVIVKFNADKTVRDYSARATTF
jgi:hypothetical protein